MVYFSPSIYFQCLCVFICSVLFCSQHILGSCFLIHSNNLWIFISTFDFKVIIDIPILRLISNICITIFCLLPLFSSYFCLSLFFLLIVMLIKHFMFFHFSLLSVSVILFKTFLVVALEFIMYTFTANPSSLSNNIITSQVEYHIITKFLPPIFCIIAGFHFLYMLPYISIYIFSDKSDVIIIFVPLR